MLREATDDDVLTIREWRNHEKVRGVSQNTEVIPLDDHLKWWAAVQGDPTRRVLIYEHDGVACGVVNFAQITTDPDGTPSAEWGFFLDTDGVAARGNTLSVWMGLEKAAIDYAFDVLKLGVLRGETLGWNTAVRQLHKRFGMTEPGSIYRLIDGELTEVVFNELLVENRRR
jgi:RimJ/RimL family protein N-acetyltransferase